MQGKRRFSWFRLVMVLMIAYFAYIGMQQHIHISSIDQEQEAVEAHLAEVREINQKLKEEKARLQQASYVEKVAREELGLVKPGEVPYIASN